MSNRVRAFFPFEKGLNRGIAGELTPTGDLSGVDEEKDRLVSRARQKKYDVGLRGRAPSVW